MCRFLLQHNRFKRVDKHVIVTWILAVRVKGQTMIIPIDCTILLLGFKIFTHNITFPHTLCMSVLCMQS